MSVALANLLRRAARHRLQINVWPVDGGFQANVKSGRDDSWSCYTANDAATATENALRRKLAVLEPSSGELFE